MSQACTFNLDQEMKKKLFRIYVCFGFSKFLIVYLVDYIDILKKTLRAGGNVLLPVDTAGRVLELILLLESVSMRHVLLLSFSFFFFLMVLSLN